MGLIKRIGVTCGFDSEGRASLRGAYLEALSSAGGLPFILPPMDPAWVQLYVDALEGFMLTGGGDVHPSFYNAPVKGELRRVQVKRDLFELALVKAALEARKPVLGICRGMQVINVALGGDLEQEVPGEMHDGGREGRGHPIRIERDSFLYPLLGREAWVNSRHHQGIGKLAPGLKISAVGPDGLIEAFEGEELPVLGVQWHPEDLYQHHQSHLGIFAHFIKIIR
ncbi:MAG TPA: gamma-glutamyl-gamma-aminobutyrate hydrolase family protein [Moorella mulderi]|nr:gamma-glutamyl-gamma-aminobutyrate hydrolase family protein [Moorella mulderi]